MKPKYKSGDIVGNLKIVKMMPIGVGHGASRKRHYRCLCKCGNLTIKASDYLRKSRFLSCGCVDPRKEQDRENAIIKRLYHFKISSSAVRKHIRDKSNLPFEIFKIIIKRPCFYCGVSHSLVKKDIIRNKLCSSMIVKYNGIDRVNNNLGYTIRNSVPCCSDCNLAKRLMSRKVFFVWVKKVYEFNHLNII